MQVTNPISEQALPQKLVKAPTIQFSGDGVSPDSAGTPAQKQAPSLDWDSFKKTLSPMFQEAGLSGYITGYAMTLNKDNPDRIILTIKVFDPALPTKRYAKAAYAILRQLIPPVRSQEVQSRIMRVLQENKAKLPAHVDFKVEARQPK